MSKLKSQMKPKAQAWKGFLILAFVIFWHLDFEI